MLTLVVLAWYSTGLSQNWNLSIEGGINTTGFSKHEDYSDRSPEVSPVIGFLARYTGADKLTYLDLGVRYNVVGYSYTYNSTSYSFSQGGQITSTYTIDGEQHYKFQKVAFGVGYGFSFDSKKIKPNVGIGYRLLYYPSGSFSTYVVRTDRGQPPSEVYSASYDPMDNPELRKEASHMSSEFYLQAGLTVIPRLRFEILYSLSRPITWEVGVANSNAMSQYYYEGRSNLGLSAFIAIKK